MRRRTAPSDRGKFGIITRQELLYMELVLTDDFVHHGDSTRPSSRCGGEYFPPGSFTTLACTVWIDPRRLKSRLKGDTTVISPNTFSAKYSTYQLLVVQHHYHWLEDHDRQRRLLLRRHSWSTSREGRLFDCEIFREPRKITTGKQQLEGDAPCVITGAIIDKLE